MHQSPAALALLSGIACLGTPRQAARAEDAALGLIERGIPRPGWAEHVGAVVAGDCHVNSDSFGDRDEAVCLFSYAGTEPHALVLVVDYNAHGMLSDGWVTSQVDTLLARCTGPAPRRTGAPGAARSARSPRPRPGCCWKPRSGPLTPSRIRRSASPSPPTTPSSGRGSVPCRRPTRWRRRSPSAARPTGWPSTSPGPRGPARRRGGGPGAATAGPCSSPSSSPPTRRKTCPTARRPAGAPTTSSATAASRISAARCG